MLNLHCNNNDKKHKNNNNNNNIKRIMRLSRFEPGYMGSKSTKVSTTLWMPMQFPIKIINIC